MNESKRDDLTYMGRALGSFEDLMHAARRLSAARVAVVVAHDVDAIKALAQAEESGLATGILIGHRDKISAAAAEVGIPVSAGQIIHEPDEVLAARRAIALVKDGEADFVMKGKINTAALIRAVLDKEYGMPTGRLLSQVVAFHVPGIPRLMLVSDAAINISPTLEQKADICRNAIDVAHALGIRHPYVALLCAFEYINSSMPATVDAAALTQMNRRGQILGAYLEGPLALDVVLSSFAADRKGITDPIVENADVLIAPTIEAANILYRAILYFAGGQSGGVVVGAAVPLVLLSRAETPETKLRSIAIAKLVASEASGVGAHVSDGPWKLGRQTG